MNKDDNKSKGKGSGREGRKVMEWRNRVRLEMRRDGRRAEGGGCRRDLGQAVLILSWIYNTVFHPLYTPAGRALW